MSKNSERLAIIIQPTGEISWGRMDVSYPAINRALGVQWIEAISTENCTFYLDEEGKLNGSPQNIVAEALFRGLGGYLGNDFLVGPVCVLGNPDENGDDTDVPLEMIGIVQAASAELAALDEEHRQ